MTQKYSVGVHFSRYRGGPGRLVVDPGRAALRAKRGQLEQEGGTVTLVKKRWEPPWGNHWIAFSDGERVAHVVTGRRRAEKLLGVLEENGFAVER